MFAFFRELLMIAAISESNINLPGGKRRCGDGKQGIRPQAWAGNPPGCRKGGAESERMQRVRRSYRLDKDHRGAQHADRPGAGFHH